MEGQTKIVPTTEKNAYQRVLHGSRPSMKNINIPGILSGEKGKKGQKGAKRGKKGMKGRVNHKKYRL